MHADTWQDTIEKVKQILSQLVYLIGGNYIKKSLRHMIWIGDLAITTTMKVDSVVHLTSVPYSPINSIKGHLFDNITESNMNSSCRSLWFRYNVNGPRFLHIPIERRPGIRKEITCSWSPFWETKSTILC